MIPEPTHALDTRGLLSSPTSPDAGTVSSKYDKGRNLRFAQDANQAAAGTVAFTSYDFANRPLKSGVGAATFSSLDPNAAPTTLETTNANWLVARQYDAKPLTGVNDFPWNRFATASHEAAFQARDAVFQMRLRDFLELLFQIAGKLHRGESFADGHLAVRQCLIALEHGGIYAKGANINRLRGMCPYPAIRNHVHALRAKVFGIDR